MRTPIRSIGPSMIACLGLEQDDSTADHLRNETTPNPAWLPRTPARMVHHAERTNPPRMEDQMTTTPKTNEAALAAFMAGKAEIDALLARTCRRQRRPFRHQPRTRDLGRRREPSAFVTDAPEGDHRVPRGLNNLRPRRPRPGAARRGSRS